MIMLYNFNKWSSYTVSRLIIGLVFIYVYCEYLIYYIIQVQCIWPALSRAPANNAKPVYAMVLADIHLAGTKRGHWTDKWRQEWQMHQAFQTALSLHRPEAVFILGDLFDEGKSCSRAEFEAYVQRFYTNFKVPEGTSLYVVPGEDDIGQHFVMSPQLIHRFEIKMKAPAARVVSIRGVHFVLLNSVTLHGDRCSLCSKADIQLNKIIDIMKCSSGAHICQGKPTVSPYSRPIIMQHFPLYRENDDICKESDSKVHSVLIERFDVISKEMSSYLVEELLPRAAFSGHTHNNCIAEHTFSYGPREKIKFTEYTVPSFSWKLSRDPKYYLLTVSPDELNVTVCGMPNEWSVQASSVSMVVALLVYLYFCHRSKNAHSYKQLSGKKV